MGPSQRLRSRRCLAVASVHHHLVREGTRLRAGIILESGEPREVHHFATLLGYGASAINPYLMLETLDGLVFDGRITQAWERTVWTELTLTPEQAAQNTIKAIGKGLLKTISKMGISTIQSYCGAQIFEAVGLEPALIDRHFTGTASRIGGVGLEVLATEALERHARAWPTATAGRRGRHHRACCPSAACYAVAARRRAPHVESRDDRARAARRARGQRRMSAAALEGDAERWRRCVGARRTSGTGSTRGRSTRTPRAKQRCAGCLRIGGERRKWGEPPRVRRE